MRVRPPDPTSINLSVKLYRFLVRIYPSQFRLEYGEMMVQAFRDSCLHVHRQTNQIGILALWVRTMVDTLFSVIEQYSNRGADMTRSNFIKMSGWFMAASSLFFVFSWLAGSRPEYNPYNALSLPIDGLLNVATGPLFLLGMLSISVGILGLKTFFGAQAGGLGKAGLNTSLIGTAVSIVGIIGMVISDGGPWWETTMIGVTALFIGLFLFGIRCINRKPFSRWNSLPLLTGILWPVFILSDLLVIQKTNLGFELSQAVIAGIIFTSFTGVALIGYQLQTEIQKTPPEPA